MTLKADHIDSYNMCI